MRNRAGHDIRRSFTLAELLAALALAVFVVAITGQVAVQAVVTRDRVNAHIERQYRMEAVWQWFERDMKTLLPEAAIDAEVLSVFGAPRPVLQLTVLGESAFDDDLLHVVRRPANVRYRLVDHTTGDHSTYRLIRELRDLTDATTQTVTRTLATGVASLNIKVFVDGQWSDRPDRARRDAPPIRAVRIGIGWGDEQHPQERTFAIRSRNDEARR